MVRNGKGKRPEGYVAPPPEELAKLRKVTPVEEPKSLLGSLDSALTGMGMTAPSPVPKVPEEKGGEDAPKRRRSRSRRGGSKPAGETAAPKQEQASKQPAPPKQKQGGKEQPRPPKGDKPQKNVEQPKPAAPQGEQAGAPAGEKKRPRRRYHRKPRGDKPQTPEA